MFLSSNSLVSIILPTYNRGFLILKTINSILNQTYENFELIIIDDGSTDNTSDLINSLNDERIIYTKILNSGGPAKPRNIGLNLSKGTFIAFCDDDDIWNDNKLQICINELNNRSDFVYHNFLITGGNLKHLFFNKISSRRLKIPYYNDLINNGNTIINSSVVFKKELFNNVGLLDENKNLIAAEDYDYWLRLSLVAKKMTLINLILGEYNISVNSISRNYNKVLSYTTYIKNKYNISEEPTWMLYNFYKTSTLLKDKKKSNFYFKLISRRKVNFILKIKIFIIKLFY
jgi:glycosyltransferase involved in cell wall biosynthesis